MYTNGTYMKTLIRYSGILNDVFVKPFDKTEHKNPTNQGNYGIYLLRTKTSLALNESYVSIWF